MSKTEKTISELRDELNEIVAWFEGDEFSPELAADKFERAGEITKQIESELSQQKNRITIIKDRFDLGEK